MDTEFTPIFLLIVVAVFTAISMVVLSALLGPRKTTSVKQMPYESGMDPIGDARQRFDVRYYLVAIVFLLFDVELLFLYPWAVAQWSLPASSALDTGLEKLQVGGRVAPGKMPAGGPVDVSAHGAGIPPVFRDLVFLEILLFIAILAAAFAYAWRKGVFEWR